MLSGSRAPCFMYRYKCESPQDVVYARNGDLCCLRAPIYAAQHATRTPAPPGLFGPQVPNTPPVHAR